MRLQEVRRRLRDLKAVGFIPSGRSGPTGVGYTLEQQLGLGENNLPIPDIGGRVELKATRNSWNNLITLFTFNRAAWNYPQKEIVTTWGYEDGNGRLSLYCTVSALEPNTLGLQLSPSKDANRLFMTHVPTDTELASWDMHYLVGIFVSKFKNMLFVHTDSRKVAGREEFHYTQAELLSEPNALTFRDSFIEGKVTIDIRMHLRPNGSARNHGTAFRILEQNLPSLFGKAESLLD